MNDDSQALPFFGRKPRLVVNEAGDALLVFNKGTDLEYHEQDRGGKLHVAAATARKAWTDWRVVYTSDRDYVGEPRVDVLRWRVEPAQPGQPSLLSLIDLQAEQ
jgi:hypothetical protein